MLRLRGCHFGPILGHRRRYAGLCWTCWCSCHDIASQAACSFVCANFGLGNFMGFVGATLGQTYLEALVHLKLCGVNGGPQ